MILSCGDLEKAFGFDTPDGAGRLPNTFDVLLVLFRSLRSGCGISAIEALKCVVAHPQCVQKILDLLGDDDIDDVASAAWDMKIMTHEMGDSVDIMRAWVSTQTALKAIRNGAL